MFAGVCCLCHPLLIQINGFGVTERYKMQNIYRVKFTDWKNGRDEYFFEYESDAEMFASKYKKYGYTPLIETIYMQQVGARI